ncbi:MAG: ZIP family metal transporter [Candidatus Omnitrophica bacterium]|nr:ZIP family metal transporter [Candidatus Omnitrophota bacterium]
MNLIVYELAAATFLSTLLGGLIILRFKKSIPYFFAFASGSLIAIAFLDILPESLEIAQKVGVSVRAIMLTIIGSFFLYCLLEKYFATHHLEEEEHSHPHILGPIGAGSLIAHSFLDGTAIGIAFQVNFSIGLIVAFAVILHDMTDGINTVIVMLRNHQPIKKTTLFLLLDALAPVLGLITTSLIVLPEIVLTYVLAFFVGEFIYLGASTLLPETRQHPSKKMILMMALGMLIIIVFTSFLKQ